LEVITTRKLRRSDACVSLSKPGALGLDLSQGGSVYGFVRQLLVAYPTASSPFKILNKPRTKRRSFTPSSILVGINSENTTTISS
jgi:hypothetical protein